MAKVQLPSRAKPEDLYEVCTQLNSRTIKRSQLYDEMDIDRRQITAATDFGATLGFLELENGDSKTPRVSLSDYGFPLWQADSMEEPGVKNTFRRAIESYEPYRIGLLSAHVEDRVEDINGERVISRDEMIDAVNTYVEGEADSREINLLLKTAQAAGLGKRKVGRHDYPTRLVLSDDYDDFVKELADKYELPEKTSIDPELEGTSEEESADVTGGSVTKEGGAEAKVDRDDKVADDGTAQIIAELRSNDLTLNIGIDVSDKDDQEVMRIINEIKKFA